MAQVPCVVNVALCKTRLFGGFELRWTWYFELTNQFEVWPYRGISTSYAHFRLGTIACMMPFLTPCQKSRKLTGCGQMIQRHTWANFATTSLGCRLRQGTGATTTATAINWVATPLKIATAGFLAMNEMISDFAKWPFASRTEDALRFGQLETFVCDVGHASARLITWPCTTASSAMVEITMTVVKERL